MITNSSINERTIFIYVIQVDRQCSTNFIAYLTITFSNNNRFFFYNMSTMTFNNISKDDENFLKEFLKGFYRQILKIQNFVKFEIILTEWIEDFFKYNEKNSKTILKLMEDHEENENWFSSLIGFFYEHGIGDTNIIDKNKSLRLYLLSIINKDKNERLITTYQILNIIIAKYLLSFHYYKDIFSKKYRENIHVMSYNQIENFNGL